MKKIYTLLPLLAILFSCWSSPTFAQEAEGQNRIVIIKKSIDENGVETIEKTIKEGSDTNVFTWENENGEEMSFDLEGASEGDQMIHIRMNGDNGEESFSLNTLTSDLEDLKEKLEEFDFRMNNENGDLFLNFSENNVFGSCKDKNGKPFLGIVMQESIENEDGVETIEGVNEQGVIVQRVVDGSAAEAAGLQKGDIITSIDGQATKRISNVSTAIQSKKVGNAITVSYIRDGKSNQVTATLKGKTQNNYGQRQNRKDYSYYNNHSYKVDPCKVFIGVYTGTGSSPEGLRVNGVIEDTPAFDAGLLKGDRILKLDGVAISSHQTLLAERNRHEAGEEFTITYLRDGQTYTVDAKFKECKNEEIEREEAVEEREEDKAPERRVSTMLDLNLEAFPNPTSSSVNIRFAGERTSTVVTVTDINGKEIFREELKNFDGLYNKKVSLNGAATGAVIISVQQGNQIRSEKILYTPDRA